MSANVNENENNLVGYNLDESGDLYLKYFFADGSMTEGLSNLGGVPGRFSLDGLTLPSKDAEAENLPFSILPNKGLSLKGDWHPWSWKEGATWEDHVEFARRYSPGHIVRLTPDTKLTGGAIDSIRQNNGRFAIVKITDTRARDAYVSDPSLIPKQVSPGYLNFEYPNFRNVKNFRWAHLAAVPTGAYGPKATVYASCLGGNECVNHLVGASVAELDEKLGHSYCPIGASEFQLLSSQGISNQIQSSMNDTANSTGLSTPQTTATPQSIASPVSNTNTSTSQLKPKGNGAPLNSGTPNNRVIRLKTQKPNTNVNANLSSSDQPDPNNPDNGQNGGGDESTQLREEVEKLKAFQQQVQRREEIKRLIPKEPFINKGRFDEKAFDAEVEKRLTSNATDEQIKEHYDLVLEHKKLLDAYPEMQKLHEQQQQGGQGQQYETPKDMPTGGSAVDKNDFVGRNITELVRRVIIQ